MIEYEQQYVQEAKDGMFFFVHLFNTDRETQENICKTCTKALIAHYQSWLYTVWPCRLTYSIFLCTHCRHILTPGSYLRIVRQVLTQLTGYFSKCTVHPLKEYWNSYTLPQLFTALLTNQHTWSVWPADLCEICTQIRSYLGLVCGISPVKWWMCKFY